MISYIIRRLLLLIPTIFVAISLLFFIFFLLPGDPARALSGAGDRHVSEQTLDQVSARYGLDDPIMTQFVDYWERTLEWDLGESFRTRQSVNEILGDSAVNSVRLGIWAMIIELLVGLSVGVWSAIRRYSISDRITTILTAAAAAVPVYVLGFVLMYLFAIMPGPNRWDWPEWAQLKTSGIGDDTWAFFFIPTGEQWRFLILPAVSLAAVGTALLARMMRGSMLEVLRADYMRTAKAKGLGERQVVMKHGLRNAMLPVVTVIGLDLGLMIGVAVLTEFTFSWPGLGSEVVAAVEHRDLPVILGLTLAVVVVYSIINLVVDVSYAWFDPRIRFGKGGQL